MAAILCTCRVTGKRAKELKIMKKFITVVGTAAVVVLGALGVKKFVSDRRAA